MSILNTKPARVDFFGTCVIDLMYPEAGLAAIRLIVREGVRVIFPSGQSCCGQPGFNSGFPDEAREVARRQLRTFDQDYPIVVPSGSCAGMMKHHYAELFAGDRDQDKARRFSNRIFEFSEFLVKVWALMNTHPFMQRLSGRVVRRMGRILPRIGLLEDCNDVHAPRTAFGPQIEASWSDDAQGLPALGIFGGSGEDFRVDLFGIDAAITTTLGAIAETGSLVPPVHIAILEAKNIFNTFCEIIQQQNWPQHMPANALLISGPSKTADIEMTLAFGVHGPRELIVLVLEENG